MSDSPPNTSYRYLGRLSYAEGLKAQEEALAELRGETHAVLLGLEHDAVVTLGVRGRADIDLQITEESLRQKGVELATTTRGGQATVHSPGQLVIYPCISLRAFGLGPRTYVELVQTTTARWLRETGLQIECVAGAEPGLFHDEKKLVAFGFKIAHGLTSHGLAINVHNDLGLFDLIRICGVSGQKVTSLKNLGEKRSLEALFLSWADTFADALNQCEQTYSCSPPPTVV